jgi:mycofactocin system glycosyltransferase
MFVPTPPEAAFGRDDVTVVIPVRDRPEQLRRLLLALQGLTCIVVDDASSDPSTTENIARRVGASFIGLTGNVGPAGARNAGLQLATSALVAFIDSDCLPTEEWLAPLLGHFNDPLVAAVAPRIVPVPAEPATTLSGYDAVRSPLDMGDQAGPVRQHSKVSYVPSAALVVRRQVTNEAFFDPALRGGEDVDLVWRLGQAGWDVRYVPDSLVHHDSPGSVPSWLSRRFFYGTTAGPLALRHPGALPPVQTSAWTAGVWALLLVRRPVLAGGVLAASVAVLARRLTGVVHEPLKAAATIACGGTVRSTLPALAGLTRAWSPALCVGLLFGRTRRAAAAALLVPAVRDWFDSGGGLNPVDYSALHVADDVAYGTGVWVGCLRARTLRPLIPRIALRSRTWSVRTLGQQREDGPA